MQRITEVISCRGCDLLVVDQLTLAKRFRCVSGVFQRLGRAGIDDSIPGDGTKTTPSEDRAT